MGLEGAGRVRWAKRRMHAGKDAYTASRSCMRVEDMDIPGLPELRNRAVAAIANCEKILA